MPKAKVSESRLWAWMTSARMIIRESLHMCRLENSAVKGTPDVEGCLCGNQFWIELKTEPRRSYKDTKIKPKFQDGQIPWFKRRIKAGGRRLYVLLQVGSGNAARRYLIPGYMVETLKNDGMTEEELYINSVCNPKANPARLIFSAAQMPYSYKEN